MTLSRVVAQRAEHHNLAELHVMMGATTIKIISRRLR
jgi:hypothetical protein